ncbi:uncharacterized protein LOC112170711 [Rosa chinensis]|uniref:uncharacterized protein LOC112170711 n=1 Tax=Rosa chinensis TaxID=74649 RepID=UPI000D087245|nr:uncharacterized protein LOC112170711 [Rosa chinensis]
MAWYEEFLQAIRSMTSVSHKRTKAATFWFPPMVGMLCLNVDGTYVPSLQHGGIGGVLRNEKGEFIAGFAYRVPNVSSPYHTELLAIKYGLEIIQALEEDQDLSPLGTIVEEIKGLLAALQSIGVHHTYRTANHVAHRLAGLGFDSDIHMEWFFQAPESVLDALQYDCNRMNH